MVLKELPDMRKASSNIILSIGLMLVLCAGGASAQESLNRVGTVIDVDGPRLYADRLKRKSWFQAYSGMPTFLAERLRTDKLTQAVLQFDIGGRAGIGRNSSVEIISPKDVENYTPGLKVNSGLFWGNMDRLEGSYQIQTAGGVIGIEGTELLVGVDPETGVTEVLLFEGQVSVVDAEGKKKTLAPGDYAEFGGSKGMCVLSYPSASLRTLVVERFPAFSSFIANQNVTSIPQPASPTLIRGANKTRPDLLAVLKSAQESGGPSVSGLQSSGRSGPPSFTWQPVSGAESYALYLSGDQGADSMVFSSRTEKPSLLVPEGAQGLEAGSYFWSVVALDKDGNPISKPGQARFETSGWETPGVTLEDEAES